MTTNIILIKITINPFSNFKNVSNYVHLQLKLTIYTYIWRTNAILLD